jgi:8-oxo-dGTP pyrophosphatase MutT (NUDIX family)
VPTASPAPRPAATVLLLRDAPGGGPLQVFLQRRVAGMAFAGGMTVFPGGGVDSGDRPDPARWRGPGPEWWAQRFACSAEVAGALVVAAVRETFEECGVLLAGPADDPDALVSDVKVYHGARDELASNSLAFSDFLRRENLVLRADLLRPWANWVTPEQGHTRRYDTYFFVAALPDGQHADGKTSEASSAKWALPAAAIDDFAARRTFLLPPTWTQLDTLPKYGSTVDEILSAEREVTAMRTEVVGTEGNWSLDFFDVERYDQVRQGRSWS